MQEELTSRVGVNFVNMNKHKRVHIPSGFRPLGQNFAKKKPLLVYHLLKYSTRGFSFIGDKSIKVVA